MLWILHRITQLIKSIWCRPPRSSDIPVEVSDQETIIRAVFYPHHFNKSGRKLTRYAFRAPPDMDEVSTIRKNYVGSQFCKDKAKGIELNGKCQSEDTKDFRGFASISADEIYKAGSNIRDSRHVYVAHADITHGYTAKRGESLPSWLNDRLDRLRDSAKFIPDPAPTKWRWVGQEIT